MELPEPARELWFKIREPLRNALNKRLHEFQGWKLSGGTILAAQWHHRKSTDIDLKIHPKAGIRGLDPRYDASFGCEMVELGASEPTHGQDQVIIPFPNGKIDIFQAETEPTVGERLVNVDGVEEVVLSNAQILSGKIAGRGLDSPTRDLFDIAVAAEMDPRALEVAVNAIPDSTWGEIVNRWEEASDFHRAAASEALTDVPPRWQHLAEDPARAAIDAAAKARYTQLTIRWSNDEPVIRTESTLRGEQEQRLGYATRAAIEAGLEESGVRGYLENRTPTATKTVIERIEATKKARTGIIHSALAAPGGALGTETKAVIRGRDNPAGGPRTLDTRSTDERNGKQDR